MLFSGSRNIDYNSLNISILIGVNIERVTEYKYLGTDDKLIIMIS